MATPTPPTAAAATGTSRSTVRTASDAVAAIRPGMTLMVGGFGLVGSPLTLIEALRTRSTADEDPARPVPPGLWKP